MLPEYSQAKASGIRPASQRAAGAEKTARGGGEAAQGAEVCLADRLSADEYRNARWIGHDLFGGCRYDNDNKTDNETVMEHEDNDSPFRRRGDQRGEVRRREPHSPREATSPSTPPPSTHYLLLLFLFLLFLLLLLLLLPVVLLGPVEDSMRREEERG
jgi:hypothetical protein